MGNGFLSPTHQTLKEKFPLLFGPFSKEKLFKESFSEGTRKIKNRKLNTLPGKCGCDSNFLLLTDEDNMPRI